MTDKPIVRIGNRIRQLRKERGISQEGLANLTQIDRSYMGAIERGERNISILKFFHICKALNISPSEALSVLDDPQL